jgi:acyl dehydratase
MKIADINQLKVGDTASCEMFVDERAVATFAALSGDDNALHMDAAVASERGFPKRVAHGMLALSAISRLIGTELPGHGSLWTTQEFQFRQPVLVGDTITATVTLEQISLGAQMIKLKTEVVNKTTGAVVLTGFAKVRIPPKQVPA